MEPTDTSHPDYYHRVVDCQWACPAHTDVPEYIRLIAQGRFTDAYMVNRHSNVFPGILGRVCDRPCEPACRRGRIEQQKPVAICRLKRVAADHRDEVASRLPKIPKAKNGKRIACIGAGCASLTVANDLMPLGYQVTIFEQYGEPGGLMRTNIPSFRLPQTVLNEEIAMITGMGVELKLNSPVGSLRRLLTDGGFDAVFVGSGAPKGKELKLPGREAAAANVHIGIAWLESVAFGHIDAIGARVLIIGVGNTAMDCCRTSLRLGAESVKVMARKPRGFFKASEWELEDAEEESVELIIDRAPRWFVIEDGKLTGMRFDKMEYELDAHGRITDERCAGEAVSERLAPGMNLQSRKMGMHEWSYANDYSPVERRLMPHVSLKERFKKLNIEVELGFTAEQVEQEVQRCLNCDVQTVFTAKLCIECDACLDICPVDCLTITHNGPEGELRTRLKAPAKNLEQPLYVSAGLPQTGRVMVKDEDLCVHCGLCAERCPTAAWDMQKSELHWPLAGDEARMLEARKPKIA